MSQSQEPTIKIERRAQLLSYIEPAQRYTNEQETFTHQTTQVNVQLDSQVLSFLDSIIIFIKTTFLSSKQNFALFILAVIYLFSNWSITLQNRKGYSIDFIDILFIVLVVYVIRAWITGEGFASIFDLISGKTQQVISFTQQGLSNQQQGQQKQQQQGGFNTNFQNLFKSESASSQNVRKLQTVEQLYEKYMQEKFQLCEQNFLDCEIVSQLTTDAHQKLTFLINEYQKQFEREIPFAIADVNIDSLPSNITTESEFQQRILIPHFERVKEFVKFRFSFDYNLQNPTISTKVNQNNQQSNTPKDLYNDLLKTESDLLQNRSMSIFAYSNQKQLQFNNCLQSFFENNWNLKIEDFNSKNGGDDVESFDVVLGNSERQEVELKKFVKDPVNHKTDSLEALLIADKIIERQNELEEVVKNFKKTSKQNVIDHANKQKGSLLGVVNAEEQNQESLLSKIDPEQASKKLETILSEKIEQILKESKSTDFNLSIFEKYFDHAQEQTMKCESKSNTADSNRKSISNILEKELELVNDKPSKEVQPSLDKYLQLITKFEYFVDQYKDDKGYLGKIRDSYENYVDKTLNSKNKEKQQRRLKIQLNKVKDSLISEYLVQRFKKQLAEINNQYNNCSQQFAKLQEEIDVKDRKLGLLEEQVVVLQEKIKKTSEKLGIVEISYDEEKQNLLRDIENKKQKIDELSNQINNVKAPKEEKKESISPTNVTHVDAPEEMALRKTTSYQASITILEKSVRGITEVFYDKFRNTAYFNQMDMIDQLKSKFGDSIFKDGELTQDQKDFIIKQFEDKFIDAEEKFLTKNLGGEIDGDSKNQNKKSILNSLDKNFDVLKTRLNKAKDISDIQQVKITSAQDERDALKIIDDIVNGALTDTDETYNRQLIQLKKIMLRYKGAPGNVRASVDLSKQKNQPAAPHQRVKQKIESCIAYISENMNNIKSQMQTVLSEDMRRTLKSKIVEWKKSQEDKKEVMKKWNLQSQNMWFTLIWHDANDLDLVVKCPCGQKIYYGTKKCEQCGTYLEIDMNAGGNKNDKFPVEHIYLMKPPKVGSQWEVYCKMFHCNNNKDSPFTIQIEHEDGRIVSYQGTLDINENPQSPIYKYTVDKGIDEQEKNLILKIRKTIDEQEEFCFF